MSYVIIGASTGPGRLLFEQLRDEGAEVVGIARDRRDLVVSGRARFVELDVNDVQALADEITEHATLIHCSRPELLTAYLLTDPALGRLIALGSTRVYTRFPDDKCDRLAAMSHAIWMRDYPSTLLHPTMTYGAPGLNNIERVMRIARLSPMIPLPEHGKSLIQPVFAGDVVKAIKACLSNDNTIGKTLVVPGCTAITYRAFIERCIALSGARCKVVSLPYWLLYLLAPVTRFLPGVPDIGQDEIRRLLEDKNFSPEDLTDLLGVHPVDLDKGLTLAGWRRQTAD